MDRKGFFICWGGQGARALVCTCPARSNFFPFPKLPLAGAFALGHGNTIQYKSKGESEQSAKTTKGLPI
jgi:hypothetical protein